MRKEAAKLYERRCTTLGKVKGATEESFEYLKEMQERAKKNLLKKGFRFDFKS